MGQAFILDLFASEYSWDYARVRQMTFLQTHLQLSKIVERKRREAGIEEEKEAEMVSASGFAGFMS